MSDQITIDCIDYREVRLLCHGEWRTLKRYDIGFDDIYRLYFRAKAAHELTCKVECQGG